MDGINNNDGVCIIGATNRADLLDSALIRPGRFDHKIEFTFPDKKSRITILKLYLNKIEYDTFNINENYLENLSNKCDKMTGAELESIINIAASLCYADNRQKIEKKDVEEALKQVLKDKKQFQ